MASLEDTAAAATKILSEDPVTEMGGSGSKPKENGSGTSDIGKDNGGELVFETKVVEKDDNDLQMLSDGTNDEVASNGINGGSKNSNNQDYVFRVGDLVWGKIRSHPWWPAQIYDPKDASEFALEIKQEGRFLVAFFGDGSCSWCSPSQLIPFVENFSEMAINYSSTSSRSFRTAVESAIEGVSRLVELEMTCNCATEEKKTRLACCPVVENSGLKEGVLMQKVDFNRLSIPKFESKNLLEKVKHLAKSSRVENALENRVLKSWLSSYYCYKGGYDCHLAEYQEPLYIEGLEDKNKNGDDVADDFSVPIEVPLMGPREDDGIIFSSSPNKTAHKRKQKSVAELMGENKNTTIPEETKKTSSHKRKKKTDAEHGGALVVGIKPKEIEGGEGKEVESEGVTTPRERKKSKYLSPPYTNPTWRVGNSSFKTTEPAAESNDKITKIPPSVEDVAIVDKASEKNLTNGKLEDPGISVSTTPKTIIKNDEKKLTFNVSDVGASVSKLLSEIQLAAVDHLHLSKEGSLDMVWAFVSALRSSTYLQGSDYKMYRKVKTRGKRKSRLSQLGDVKDDVIEKKAKSSDETKVDDLGDDGQEEEEDDCLISDVGLVRQKLEIMTAIMENYYSKFSAEDKGSLKSEVKELMEKVETVSEKVRVMAENTSS
ncbi:hypothetical protein ABFS83_11G122900 [Erythranthe nasuta]